MSSFHRALLGASTLSLLAACNLDVSSSGNPVSLNNTGSTTTPTSGGTSAVGFANSTGNTPPAPSDSVNATPSVAGTVSVTPGAAQTLTVAFTSADGRPISGLELSNTTLPAGSTIPFRRMSTGELSK